MAKSFLDKDGLNYLWDKITAKFLQKSEYVNMKGATASAAGKAGLVPAPAAGAQGKFLRGDGAWAAISNILDVVHPIGSLYWSKNPTNPAELFGGTWKQIKDTFILAAGDTYDVGATGGAATVALTVAQLPAHNHSGSAGSAGAHKHTLGRGGQTNNGATLPEYWDTSHWLINGGTSMGEVSTTGAHTHTLSINNTGSGNAHNNMPPYVTYYCWERTA